MSYIYIIVMVDPIRDEWASLKEKYPDRHRVVNDRMAFVAPNGISTTVDILNMIRMSNMDSDKKHESCIVIDLTHTAYTGWLDAGYWEWIDKAKRLRR